MLRNNKGFTILELLIVVAVIAIIAAIAVPSFIGKIDKSKDSADLAEINAVQKAVALYYVDNGNYPTLQGVDTSLSQPQPVDGSSQNVDFSKLVPNYLASLPHFSYWWVDYKGNVYHTQKPIGNVTGSVFTPQTGYTYKLYKADGSTQVLSGVYTFQAGEYVLGKDEKGRDLPKISTLFKNEKQHPESPEYTGASGTTTTTTTLASGAIASGNPATMLTAEQWATFDWSTVKAPEGQVTADLGVDSWGNPVNMDLWSVCKITDEYYGPVGTVALSSDQYGGMGYLGMALDGYIPARVKLSGDTTFVPVTSLISTFNGCNLTTAPVIPSSVTNLDDAFAGCKFTTAPVIPSGVTSMVGTFSSCANLVTAPVIPNGVTNMNNTFYNCTSLTTAPMIPSGVIYKNGIFDGCTSLK